MLSLICANARTARMIYFRETMNGVASEDILIISSNGQQHVKVEDRAKFMEK